MDDVHAREIAQLIVRDKDWDTPYCGFITGTVTVVGELPYVYFHHSGLGLRLMEGTYLGKTVFYFKMEYTI